MMKNVISVERWSVCNEGCLVSLSEKSKQQTFEVIKTSKWCATFNLEIVDDLDTVSSSYNKLFQLSFFVLV